jgi:hypothetical protein
MRKTQSRTGQSQEDIILIPDILKNGENVEFLNAYSKFDIFFVVLSTIYITYL